jgi:hypothetical protein
MYLDVPRDLTPANTHLAVADYPVLRSRDELPPSRLRQDAEWQHAESYDAQSHFQVVVPRGGIEPPTHGFSVRCSTN